MTAPTDTTPAPWDEARLAEHEEDLYARIAAGEPGPWHDALECVAALRDALGIDDPQLVAMRDGLDVNQVAARRDDYGPAREFHHVSSLALPNPPAPSPAEGESVGVVLSFPGGARYEGRTCACGSAWFDAATTFDNAGRVTGFADVRCRECGAPGPVPGS